MPDNLDQWEALNNAHANMLGAQQSLHDQMAAMGMGGGMGQSSLEAQHVGAMTQSAQILSNLSTATGQMQSVMSSLTGAAQALQGMQTAGSAAGDLLGSLGGGTLASLGLGSLGSALGGLPGKLLKGGAGVAQMALGAVSTALPIMENAYSPGTARAGETFGVWQGMLTEGMQGLDVYGRANDAMRKTFRPASAEIMHALHDAGPTLDKWGKNIGDWTHGAIEGAKGLFSGAASAVDDWTHKPAATGGGLFGMPKLFNNEQLAGIKDGLKDGNYSATFGPGHTGLDTRAGRQSWLDVGEMAWNAFKTGGNGWIDYDKPTSSPNRDTQPFMSGDQLRQVDPAFNQGVLNRNRRLFPDLDPQTGHPASPASQPAASGFGASGAKPWQSALSQANGPLSVGSKITQGN